MQVRRTPQTRVSSGQRGYAQAQGLDFSPIQQGITAITEEIRNTQRSRQEFDLRRRLLQETNELQEDIERRKRDPNMNPATFAEETNGLYTQRMADLTEEYAQQGYDRDLVEGFSLQLDQLRGGLFENALGYQLGALGEQAVSNTENVIDEGTRGVVNNWDDYEVFLETGLEAIDINPDLTEQQRIGLRQNLRDSIRVAGARAWATADPDGLISSLDPTGMFTSEAQPTVTGSAASVVASDAAAFIKDREGFRTDAYWDVNHFRTGYGSDTVTRADGTVETVTRNTVVTQEDAERDLARRLGELDTSIGDRTQGWVALPENVKAAVLSVAYNYGVAHDRLNPIWDAVQAGDTDRIASLIESFQNDNGGINRERRRLEAEMVRIAVPPSTAAQSDFAPQIEGLPTEAEVMGMAEVNHPLLRDLTGEERLQALAWAQQGRQSNRAAQRGAMDVLLGNVEAEILTNGGQVSSPMPSQEEILQAYGPIEGPQKWARLQQLQSTATAMQSWATLPPAQIDAALERLRPQEGDPTYATRLQVYEGAVEARDAIMTRRAEDPAQYAIDNVPAVQAALESGNIASYHAAVRRAQEELGIPETERSLYPASVIASEREAYPTLTGAQRVAKLRQWRSGATEDEFFNFTRGLEGTHAYDDALIYETMRTWAGSQATLPLVMEGRFALEEDPSRRPSTETIQTNFRSAMFDTVQGMNPRASRAINEAAIAIYVARGGRPEATQFDSSLYQESLRQAVGGIAENSETGWYNNRRNGVTNMTILPPRITRSQFENWTEGLTRGDLTRLSVNGNPPVYANGQPVDPSDIADEGVFVMVAPGVYGIKFGSNEWAFDAASRRPFYLRVDTDAVRGTPATRRQVSLPQVTGVGR